MKKQIATVLMASTMVTGVFSNTAFAEQVLNNMQKQENIDILKNLTTPKTSQNATNLLAAEIDSISLTVTPNGVMKKTSKGLVSTINYNAQNGCNFTFLKLMNWNGSFAALVYDNIAQEKKVITSGLGTIWQPITYDYFAESDIDYVYGTTYKINDIAVYGDQLYLACDDGVVLVITPCIKCYKLKKVSSENLNDIKFTETTVIFNEGSENAIELPISSVRQNNISVEEALTMYASGALFIDVRDVSEFNEYHYADSINIPVANINEIDKFSRDTTLIFYCKSGGRASKAVQAAQAMGFINVYNLGSVDSLVDR